MCGINGLIHKNSENNLAYRINRMNESIAHRGPEVNKITKITDNAYFGHRRLSIIDLEERSNQPMISNSGRWTITFNGEIYNYETLKKDLTYDFKTESDTEVILACIELKGIDYFLDKCNGMFAIGLFDSVENSLYLLRDRIGIKPLYYYYDEQSFIFSSEIKGVLSSGLVDAQFNECAVDEYLGNRYVRAPYTFFENVYQVQSGSYVKLNSKHKIDKTKYWDLPEEFLMASCDDDEIIVNDFHERLKKSIEIRQMSDVTLGTYLSGGVDSSLITALTCEGSEDLVNTYTIGFPELNEFYYSDMIATKYNTKHHKIVLDESNYFDLMNEVISYKDAPLAVPNEIPLAYMSKVLKEDITVVLSGEGADELLGGYGKIFRLPFDYENHHNQEGSSFYQAFIDKYEYIPRKLRDRYLNTGNSLREYYDDKIEEMFSKNVNESNVFRYFHKYHVPGLLQRVDTTTMLASVEARVPFLDHTLIEYSYRKIPYDLKLKWKSSDKMKAAKLTTSSNYSEVLDTPKYLLKKISEEYLPDEIIYREKMGFPVPLNNWFKYLKEEAKYLLKDAYWFKYDKLDQFLHEINSVERFGQVLWMIINVELFRKQYFEKNWRY